MTIEGTLLTQELIESGGGYYQKGWISNWSDWRRRNFTLPEFYNQLRVLHKQLDTPLVDAYHPVVYLHEVSKSIEFFGHAVHSIKFLLK